MQLIRLDSQFLHYLIDNDIPPGERLPALNDISLEMGISVGKLREQMERDAAKLEQQRQAEEKRLADLALKRQQEQKELEKLIFCFGVLACR